MSVAVNSVTPDRIDSRIVDVDFLQPKGTLTIALLTLQNGMIITGESACVDPVNFDALKGRTIALANAKQKIWALEGYLLAQELQDARDARLQREIEVNE